MDDYIINVHAMKSALSAMGKTRLSDWALSLEEAGHMGRMEIADKETPVFIKMLKDYVLSLCQNKKEWLEIISEAIDEMLMKLLHSDFEEIPKIVRQVLDNI